MPRPLPLLILMMAFGLGCASPASTGATSSGSATGGGTTGGVVDAGGMTCSGGFGTVTCPAGEYCTTAEPTCFPISATGGSTGGGSTSTGGTSGGSTGGGPCDVGSSPPFITVTLQKVGIHPAEIAGLAARGMSPPSTIGEHVSIQGISLCNLVPSYTTLGTITITAQNQNGPLVFPNLAVGGVNLGVIASYDGYGTINNVPILPPTCAQIGPDGGYTNYPAATASEVYVGTPTADITVPAAFNLSWDYATLLDCAQGLTPGTLLSSGFALLYATEPTFSVDGGIADVTFTGSPAAGTIGYFAPDYSAAASAKTSANGVATLSGATYQLITVSATATGATFASHELAALPKTAYQVYFTPQ